MPDSPQRFAVYVATAYHNRQARDPVIAALAEAGITITYDWANEPEESLEQAAQADFDGVAEADAFVVLLPGGKGTHVELGIALGRGVPVVLCAADGRPEGWEPQNADQGLCPFYTLPGVTRVSGFSVEAVLAVSDGARS
jgi:nucleoside 2-deoxyribosyltransferase